MRFTIGIKNLPAGTAYWSIDCVSKALTYVTSPLLPTSQRHTFDVPDVYYFRYQCFDASANYTGQSGYTAYGAVVPVVKDGGTYLIDFLTGTLTEAPSTPSEGFSFENLLPMMPNEGPPLPRMLGIYWPWYKK